MIEHEEKVNRLQRRLSQAEQRAATASQQVPNSKETTTWLQSHINVFEYHKKKKVVLESPQFIGISLFDIKN